MNDGLIEIIRLAIKNDDAILEHKDLVHEKPKEEQAKYYTGKAMYHATLSAEHMKLVKETARDWVEQGEVPVGVDKLIELVENLGYAHRQVAKEYKLRAETILK